MPRAATSHHQLASMTTIKRLLATGCLLAASLTGSGAAAETASIHLHDGTTVRGEVVGLKGGSYQIRSNSLGPLNITQDRIKLVEYGASAAVSPAAPAPSTAPSTTAAASQLSAISSRLQSSPGLLSDVQSLTNDPDIMAVVQDQEIQRLIAAGDYAALMKNAKMRKLMRNPKIRSLTNALK